MGPLRLAQGDAAGSFGQLWVNRQDRGFVVASVMSGGPAEHAGLRAGDVIESVDGARAATMQLADFRQMLVQSPVGTRIGLGLVRGERRVPATIVLRDLVPPCKAMGGHVAGGNGAPGPRRNVD